jgi:hypothetical protein
LTYPFENKFLVAQPSAVVSSEKLNIMYLKIPNEINISVPGVASEKVRVSAENCSVNKISHGKFNITPSRAGNINFIVQAEIRPGEWETMGSYQWKAKQLPEPGIYLGVNAIKSKHTRSELIANGKILARYSPDFPMNSNPKISTCKIEIYTNGALIYEKNIPGGNFSQEVIDKINSARPGSMVYFSGKTIGEDQITYPFDRSLILR